MRYRLLLEAPKLIISDDMAHCPTGTPSLYVRVSVRLICQRSERPDH